VEKMRSKDFSFSVELANTMNWNMTAADFEFNLALEPNGCFTLLENSKPIGIATCISYGRIGWFGNLVVNQTYRKRGAGTFLINHAVNYLKNAGATTIGLYAYQQLTGFYGKIGFKRDVDFVVLKADRVSVLSGNTGKLKALEPQDVPAIVDFDGYCFGASRKKLLEPILKNKGNPCYFAAEGSEIVGYVAAKVFDEMVEVGPLVCRRNHPGIAAELFKAVLGKLEGLESYIYLPASETALLDTAFKIGFREEFRLARMFLGSAVAEDCVYVAESLERG